MNEWRVAANYVCGKIIYQVFRILRLGEVDHSGNREFARGLFETEQEAQAYADELNKAGEPDAS